MKGLFCGLFLFLQKVTLWKIPFEISQPLLNCENYVSSGILLSFYKNKCTGSAVYNGFTALPLHFNFTYLQCNILLIKMIIRKRSKRHFFSSKRHFFHQNVPCWRRVKLILGLPCLPTWIVKRFNPSYTYIEFIRWFHEISVTTNLLIFQETEFVYLFL